MRGSWWLQSHFNAWVFLYSREGRDDLYLAVCLNVCLHWWGSRWHILNREFEGLSTQVMLVKTCSHTSIWRFVYSESRDDLFSYERLEDCMVWNASTCVMMRNFWLLAAKTSVSFTCPSLECLSHPLYEKKCLHLQRKLASWTCGMNMFHKLDHAYFVAQFSFDRSKFILK